MQQGNGLFTSRTPNVYDRPPIKKEILKDIKNGVYVEFDKLLPVESHVAAMQNEGGLELHFDRKTNQPTLRTSQAKSRIHDFEEWMEAWNVFVQARLHYHPIEAPLLFAYQRTISRLARYYSSPAVMNYDKYFRQLMESQQSAPPSERKAHWGKLDEGLDHRFLRDHRQSAVKCFHCNRRGHVSNRCPSKSADSSQAGQRSNTQRTDSIPSLFSVTQPPPPPRPPANNSSSTPRNGRRRNRSDQLCRNQYVDACSFGRGCQFQHICARCQQPGHDADQCASYTSTPWRPQG